MTVELRTRIVAAACMLLAALALAAPRAFAAPSHDEPAHGGGHVEAAAGSHAPSGHEDGHHDDGQHGDAHGDDHGGGHGHHYYTADDDQDGVPNWRDPRDGFRDNTDTYVVTDIGWHAFNLLILFALLGYFGRQPIADIFRGRALGISNSLRDTAQRRSTAQQRHDGILARLQAIEQEVEDLHKTAKVEAEREEEALVARAEREAERIAEQAQRSIRDETTRARNLLRQEAVELAVQLAEETLRSKIASQDQRSLAQDFLKSLQADDSEGGAAHG